MFDTSFHQSILDSFNYNGSHQGDIKNGIGLNGIFFCNDTNNTRIITRADNAIITNDVKMTILFFC